MGAIGIGEGGGVISIGEGGGAIGIGEGGGAFLYYFIIIIKKVWQCKAERGRLTPYQSEDPSPTLSTYRPKKEKGKIVEDKKGESN